MTLDDLCERLSWHLHEGVGASATWLNHYSAQIAIQEPALREVTYVGVDGKFLQRLVKASHRTSADLLLPRLLGRSPQLSIAIIGGPEETLSETVAAVTELAGPGSQVVFARDGYDGLPSTDELEKELRASEPQLLILGLGAGLQERLAVIATNLDSRLVAVTCGGWLDQIRTPNYYPAWAYPLRLNWLVRLAREPRRLWRRYSVDALRAIRDRKTLRRVLHGLDFAKWGKGSLHDDSSWDAHRR